MIHSFMNLVMVVTEIKTCFKNITDGLEFILENVIEEVNEESENTMSNKDTISIIP